MTTSNVLPNSTSLFGLCVETFWTLQLLEGAAGTSNSGDSDTLTSTPGRACNTKALSDTLALFWRFPACGQASPMLGPHPLAQSLGGWSLSHLPKEAVLSRSFCALPSVEPFRAPATCGGCAPKLDAPAPACHDRATSVELA